MIKKAIHSMLSAAPSVTAIVGDRIYPRRLPQRCTFPAIEIDPVGETFGHHMGGEQKLTQARIELHCLAEGPWDAEDLADRVRSAVNAKRGLYGSLYIDSCFVEDRTSEDWLKREGGEEWIDEETLALEVNYLRN